MLLFDSGRLLVGWRELLLREGQSRYPPGRQIRLSIRRGNTLPIPSPILGVLIMIYGGKPL